MPERARRSVGAAGRARSGASHDLQGPAADRLPGKYGFERWLVSRRVILAGVNRLRVKAGRPPLEMKMEPLAARETS